MICPRDGCAGTANYRIGTSGSHLHIMWSSPNNFDKHASHLAVGTDTLSVYSCLDKCNSLLNLHWQNVLFAGVTTERSDKFNDMYYQKPSWFARKYVYHDTKVRCQDDRGHDHDQ